MKKKTHKTLHVLYNAHTKNDRPYHYIHFTDEKLRLRKIKWHLQSLRAYKWQSWHSICLILNLIILPDFSTLLRFWFHIYISSSPCLAQ